MIFLKNLSGKMCSTTEIKARMARIILLFLEIGLPAGSSKFFSKEMPLISFTSCPSKIVLVACGGISNVFGGPVSCSEEEDFTLSGGFGQRADGSVKELVIGNFISLEFIGKFFPLNMRDGSEEVDTVY